MTRSANKSQYLLNTPLLVSTVIAIAVLAIAGHFWHKWQLGRLADAFIVRSEQFEKEGKYAEAAQCLFQYIQMCPQDVDGRIRLAQAFDRVADDGRAKLTAIKHYRYAVGLAPDRVDLQRRLAELLLETGDFTDADNLAKAILKKHPDDAGALVTHASASYLASVNSASADWSAISSLLTKALGAAPANVNLANYLADTYRARVEPSQPLEADQVMNHLVEVNNGSVKALLARYQYRLRFGLEGADEDLETAIRLAPDDPNVLLFAGERSIRNRNWEEAQTHYSKLITASPRDFRGYLALGQVQCEMENVPEAIKTWRRGLSEAVGGEIPLGWRLADSEIQQGEIDAADQTIKKTDATLRKSAAQLSKAARDAISAETDFIRAKWWMAKNKPYKAAQIFNKLTMLKIAPIEGQKYLSSPAQISFMLGSVFMGTGQWDQASLAFEKALALAPDASQARFAAAQASLVSGQPDKAISHIEFLLAQKITSPELRLLYAQALFQQQLRKPAATRDWKRFEEIIAAAKANATDAKKGIGWEWEILQADYALLNKQFDRAIQALKAAEAADSESEASLKAIAICYECLNKHEEADRIYGLWEKNSKGTARAILARTASLVRRKQEALAISLLESAEQSLPDAVRPEVKHQLAQVLLRQGKVDRARQILSDVCAANPDNLHWTIELAELNLQAREFDAAQKCEQRLQDELEGPSGSWWRYFRARRLLSMAKTARDANLSEVLRLVSELETVRPNWPQTHLLRGFSAEKLNETTEAINAYRRVLELDGKSLAAYERIIPLLYREQRVDEAWKLLSQLQENQQTTQLSHFAIALSVQQEEIDRALGLANAWVSRAPKEPLSHIWLAQTLLLQKEVAKAEQELRKAIELAPQDFRVWAPLLLFYVHTKQPALARQTLEEIEVKVNLPDASKASILGQGYELIGDLEKAESYYQHATRLAPRDPGFQQRLASFLVRAKSTDADEALKKLELFADSSQARRNLAILHSKRGDPESMEKALALLDHAESDIAEAAQNERLKVGILLKRNGPGDRDRVEQLLTKLTSENRTAIPQDHLLLAGLLESREKFTAARLQYESLATSPKAEPIHWGVYADYLLRRNLLSEAAVWVRRLEEKEPDTFPTIALRARLMHLQGEEFDCETLVEPTANRVLAGKEKTEEKAAFANSVGNFYLQIGKPEFALRHFRKAYEWAPQLCMPLVATLVQTKKAAEAVEVCRTAPSELKAPLAAVLAAAMVSADSSLEDYEMAEDVFTTALEAHRDNVDLLLALSGVRFMQGKFDDVITLSRRILAIDSNHVLAMNNLASLLAEKPSDRKESLEIIDKALKVGGRLATLLDTKAMALIHEGDSREAAQLLVEATSIAPNDPRFRFHLAVAYQRLNDVDRAREQFRLAQENNLASGMLTTSERGLLEDLKRFVGREPRAKTLTSNKAS